MDISEIIVSVSIVLLVLLLTYLCIREQLAAWENSRRALAEIPRIYTRETEVSGQQQTAAPPPSVYITVEQPDESLAVGVAMDPRKDMG